MSILDYIAACSGMPVLNGEINVGNLTIIETPLYIAFKDNGMPYATWRREYINHFNPIFVSTEHRDIILTPFEMVQSALIEIQRHSPKLLQNVSDDDLSNMLSNMQLD